MPYAIATNFLPQEINLGSCRNNLSEPFAHIMLKCPICSVSPTVFPCHSEVSHPWNFVDDHVVRAYPGPSVYVPGCEGTIFLRRKRSARKSNEVALLLVRITCGVEVRQVGIPHDGDGRAGRSGIYLDRQGVHSFNVSFWGVRKGPLYADLGEEGPEGPVRLQHFDAMRNSASR